MSRDPSTRYATAVLRGLSNRLDNLERSISGDGVPNVLKSASDTATAEDEVTKTVHVGGSFTADSSASDGGDLCG